MIKFPDEPESVEDGAKWPYGTQQEKIRKSNW